MNQMLKEREIEWFFLKKNYKVNAKSEEDRENKKKGFQHQTRSD